MANTAIQNIKILHKRYSTSQWKNGISINGQTIVPTLAQGEIGLDTTTFEVRIGTNSVTEQFWSQARVIDASTSQNATYYHSDGSSSTSAISGANYVLTDAQLGTDSDGRHQMSFIYKDITLIAPEQDLTVTDGTATAGEGEIAVVTAVTGSKDADGNHTITTTKGTAATKAYVDGKFSTTKTISVEKNPSTTIPDDGSSTINYVSAVKTSTKDHTIEYEVRELVLPSIEVAGNESTGDYIKSVAVDSSDDHKIVVTKGTLPTGTGGKTAGDVEFIDSVKLEGHTLTATSKGIKGDGNVISITKDTDGKVKITADTYTKSEIDAAHNELAKAMKFKGTLDSTGVNGVTSLPTTGIKQGDVYKVAGAGTYNGQAAKVGDLFIYDGSKWRYVPSGDESFTDTWRDIYVDGKSFKDNSIGSGSIDFVSGEGISLAAVEGDSNADEIQVSLAKVDVTDITREKYKVVDGVTFDDYGRVSGSVKKTFVAGDNVQLTEDESGNLTISSSYTDTNTAHTHSVGQGLDVTGNGGIDGAVTYSHKSISTTTSAQDAKTITAGSTDNKFTVVEGYTADGMGHITEVKTREISVNIPVIEDKDTTYDLSATSKSMLSGETEANINLNASGSNTGTDSISIKVDAKTETPVEGLQVKVENDSIVLSGKATKELLGLIRAAYALNSDSSSVVGNSTLKTFTGNHNDKLYGVNVKSDGTAFVEVPWTDTITDHAKSAGGDQNKAVDMYAFGTDAFGHVTNATVITTIDGNYA